MISCKGTRFQIECLDSGDDELFPPTKHERFSKTGQ